MSTLLSTAFQSVIGAGVGFNDDRLCPPEYKTLGTNFVSQIPMDHADILWPRSQGMNGCVMVGGGGGAGLCNPDPAAQEWEWNVYTTGGRHRTVFTGQVINSSGSTVSGATVMLFNTATGLLVDTQTSDAGGNYRCSDPNAVACFLVAYLAGSPDTCGTTIDELSGV